jgi:nucleoside-diphosphate-sugar epimerase
VLTPYRSAAMWGRHRYSNAKARRALDWEPKVDFATGLARTFEWLRQLRRPA